MLLTLDTPALTTSSPRPMGKIWSKTSMIRVTQDSLNSYFRNIKLEASGITISRSLLCLPKSNKQSTIKSIPNLIWRKPLCRNLLNWPKRSTSCSWTDLNIWKLQTLFDSMRVTGMIGCIDRAWTPTRRFWSQFLWFSSWCRCTIKTKKTRLEVSWTKLWIHSSSS